MKIGEIARQIGCSVETIRFYEKEGLLPKPLRNTQNNYREYQQQHLDRLRFIRRCRSLGMTHQEIRTLLMMKNNPDHCDAINDLIDVHLQHVQHRIHEIQALEQELLNLREQCQGTTAMQKCGILKELEREVPIHDSADHIHSTQVCGHKL
ncbi:MULTISPECIES: Cd(II)/Pb(II)-responsive transcriptional regulator [unclassified Acinetobacter]|uniref:Cd(II)/Pb(II)-responsive transcriptional regulator n=1 Tax=unclassified Acinetobacter TaxID=196816 RepID=UPI0029351339|nr:MULTISPECIES: Cd(II)/Pb(II)-responsive transcriptional regulator [unclassified Acinetobacter]WOE30707.1 Cd(II)/Pb(II)-responsive transcriptional regulator [Acinetobacter sp. SAAs470]WOE38900.1 Cd(II)/Pb(II)-responsive transcriptional regulator [Acinetobacter sp. SAAs474]